MKNSTSPSASAPSASPLSAAQLQELKKLLDARRKDLLGQAEQNQENLESSSKAPANYSQDDTTMLSNLMREVDSGLTRFDAAELSRIDRALADMDAGTYGFCAACGCAIPFERLQAEPMTEHCVPCKSAWEQGQAARA